MTLNQANSLLTANVPGRLEHLDEIRQFIRAAAGLARLDQKSAYKLQLAVDEIATNVILHGYQEAGLEGGLELRAELEDNALKIELRDRAIPFNPLQHIMPTNLESALGDRPIGGLGIFLAVQNVTEFNYAFVNGQNINIFRVELPLESGKGSSE